MRVIMVDVTTVNVFLRIIRLDLYTFSGILRILYYALFVLFICVRLTRVSLNATCLLVCLLA